MAGAADSTGTGGAGAVVDVALLTVQPSDVVALAIVAAVAVVPLAMVVIVALLRGYTISLHMARPRMQRRRRGQD